MNDELIYMHLGNLIAIRKVYKNISLIECKLQNY